MPEIIFKFSVNSFANKVVRFLALAQRHISSRVEREQERDQQPPSGSNIYVLFRFSEAIMMLAMKIRIIFHPMNWISIRQPSCRRFPELEKNFFTLVLFKRTPPIPS